MSRLSLIEFILLILFFGCKKREMEVSEVRIIPNPSQISTIDSVFIIDNNTGISFSESFKNSGNFLKTFITYGSGIELTTGGDIQFIMNHELGNEAYTLKVSESKITIEASTDQGAFYAVQTLRQLFPPQLEQRNLMLDKIKVPVVTINDKPQFKYRGMHLDVGRHMYSVEFIKKYIDALAMLKMNTFHWHLTEDQGWRIEIKKYPKLQNIAAYRDQTLVGHYSDQPHQFDGKKYGGYYSQEEIKDIVAYAQERFVTIIPEIEMPGHSQAAIAAYPELGCTGKQVEVATKWGVFEEIYCPTETTFQFLEDVLDEVMELFPSTYIHIGGDEAPKTRWENSLFCQQLIKEKGIKDEHELQSYFIERIEKYLNSKGRQIIGWDEILEGGLAPNATVMSWRGVNGAIEAAKAGHNVVMTPTSHCYFDYYQSESDNEPLAIGGFLPLEKVYAFNPIPGELTEEESKFVLGAQGNVWTEYMPTEDQVEYMTFPRMLAMSEVVWSNPSQKNYQDFVSRLESFHQRLEALKINYANHLYEIKGEMITEDGNTFFELKTLTKGKTIRYTLDGSEPDENSKTYTSQIPIAESVTVRAAVFSLKQQLGKTFIQDINYHKAIGAKITIDKMPHKAYSGSGVEGLINGISGSDKRYGDKEWLGFWGDDIEITIDFDQPKNITSIETRFYDANGQWIYVPSHTAIRVFLQNEEVIANKFLPRSSDNLNHKKVYWKLPNLSGQLVETMKLMVPNYGIIPKGKQGAGNKAWTFIDEIIVN